MQFFLHGVELSRSFFLCVILRRKLGLELLGGDDSTADDVELLLEEVMEPLQLRFEAVCPMQKQFRSR